MPAESRTIATTTLGRRSGLAVILLSLAALGISAYLSYVSLVNGQSPAGCGSGSGCAEVLASKWSRVAGVPVSLLAVLTYLSVLIAFPASGSQSDSTRKLSRLALSLTAALIVSSALWFIYLQAFVLKAFCPYCMAGHTLGLLLAVLLIVLYQARQPAACGLGLLGVVLVAVIQSNATSIVVTLDPATPGGDTDTITADGRTLSLLGGQLVLGLNDEPRLGPADGEQVLVMMLDYACLHCRHTHGVIEQFQTQNPGQLTVLLLPMPMNNACNPHAPEQMHERFAESCELARTALSVYLADPDAFPEFDHWMFATEAPRTADQARFEARKRVGAGSFEQAYADPRMQQKLDRNVYAYGKSGADRVPVLIVPGRPAVVGRVDDAGVLVGLLIAPPGAHSQ